MAERDTVVRVPETAPFAAFCPFPYPSKQRVWHLPIIQPQPTLRSCLLLSHSLQSQSVSTLGPAAQGAAVSQQQRKQATPPSLLLSPLSYLLSSPRLAHFHFHFLLRLPFPSPSRVPSMTPEELAKLTLSDTEIPAFAGEYGQALFERRRAAWLRPSRPTVDADSERGGTTPSTTSSPTGGSLSRLEALLEDDQDVGDDTWKGGLDGVSRGLLGGRSGFRACSLSSSVSSFRPSVSFKQGMLTRHALAPSRTCQADEALAGDQGACLGGMPLHYFCLSRFPFCPLSASSTVLSP